MMRSMVRIAVAGRFAALLGAVLPAEAIAQQPAAASAGAGQAQRSPATPMEAASDPAQIGKQHETHHGRRVQPKAGHVAARQERLEQERGGRTASAYHGDYVEQMYRPLVRHSKHLLKGHYQHPLTVQSNHPADSAAPGAVR
jgi:hypothetical protein